MSLRPLIIFLICCFSYVFECTAGTNDSVFIVRGIKVFSEGINLEHAKENALKEGAIKAMQKLLGELVVYDQKNRYDALISTINPEKYVNLTDIKEERMTSHSFQAEVDYYFDPTKTKNLLNNAGIKYSGKTIQHILLVPILYNQKGVGTIWENKVWREAWNDIPHHIGLTYFYLTQGDLEDLESLIPNQLIAAPYKQYEQIIDVYNSQKLIAIFATELNHKLYFSLRFITPHKTYFGYQSISRKKGESDLLFYKRAAKELCSKIDSAWKGERVFDNVQLFSSKVEVKFSNSQQWQEIQKILKKIDIIIQAKVLKQDENYADLELIYTLPPLIFSQELTYEGLFLKEEKGKIYVQYKKNNK